MANYVENYRSGQTSGGTYTSFSRGVKNLKERFEIIMLMKAKNSGIVLLAVIIMLAVLASCGTGLNINKFDWTLYTDTVWRHEKSDSDLYFKDKGKGIVFDLFISRICIAENTETAGNLKTSSDGFVDSFKSEYDGISTKASITFSPDGDYVIVSITEISGAAVNTGEYRFVKATANQEPRNSFDSGENENSGSDSDKNESFYGTFQFSSKNAHLNYTLEIELILNLDGTAFMRFYTVAQTYDDTIGTYKISNNKIIYTRVYAADRSADNPYSSSIPYNEKFTSIPETTVFTMIDNNTLQIEDDYFIAIGSPKEDQEVFKFLSRV